jgi:hypothetical protein
MGYCWITGGLAFGSRLLNGPSRWFSTRDPEPNAPVLRNPDFQLPSVTPMPQHWIWNQALPCLPERRQAP